MVMEITYSIVANSFRMLSNIYTVLFILSYNIHEVFLCIIID